MKKFTKGLTITFICIAVITAGYFLLRQIVFYFYYPQNDYTGWQDVTIEKIGTFKVSEDRVVTQKACMLYITDKPIDEEDFKIYLVGKTCTAQDEFECTNDHGMLEGIGYGEWVKNQIFSNNATYGQNKYNIAGETVIKSYVNFVVANPGDVAIVELIAWDDLVDEDTMIKIAESFKMRL